MDELARRIGLAVRGASARLELLFVDDGSADATPQRLAALCAADKDLESIRHTRSVVRSFGTAPSSAARSARIASFSSSSRALPMPPSPSSLSTSIACAPPQ